MSQENPKVDDIRAGALTSKEIEEYFNNYPKKTNFTHCFDRQKSESSPELSKSFEEYLASVKSAKSEAALDKDEMPLENECTLMEIAMCEVEDDEESEGPNTFRRSSLKIRDSLLMATMSPQGSFFVNKSRPHYVRTEEEPIDFEIAPENPFVAISRHILIPEEIKREPVTPKKKLAPKDKFAHIKSPVAAYINNTPFCPLVASVKVNENRKIDREEFRKTLVPTYSKHPQEPALPMRKLLKSTKVKEVEKFYTCSISVHEKKRSKKEREPFEFLNDSVASDEEEMSDSDGEEAFNWCDELIGEDFEFSDC